MHSQLDHDLSDFDFPRTLLPLASTFDDCVSFASRFKYINIITYALFSPFYFTLLLLGPGTICCYIAHALLQLNMKVNEFLAAYDEPSPDYQVHYSCKNKDITPATSSAWACIFLANHYPGGNTSDNNLKAGGFLIEPRPVRFKLDTDGPMDIVKNLRNNIGPGDVDPELCQHRSLTKVWASDLDIHSKEHDLKPFLLRGFLQTFNCLVKIDSRRFKEAHVTKDNPVNRMYASRMDSEVGIPYQDGRECETPHRWLWKGYRRFCQAIEAIYPTESANPPEANPDGGPQLNSPTAEPTQNSDSEGTVPGDNSMAPEVVPAKRSNELQEESTAEKRVRSIRATDDKPKIRKLISVTRVCSADTAPPESEDEKDGSRPQNTPTVPRRTLDGGSFDIIVAPNQFSIYQHQLPWGGLLRLKTELRDGDLEQLQALVRAPGGLQMVARGWLVGDPPSMLHQSTGLSVEFAYDFSSTGKAWNAQDIPPIKETVMRVLCQVSQSKERAYSRFTIRW